MPSIVRHTYDHRGMKTSLCPTCGTQFVYWDPEDLDENGDLLCYCDADPYEGYDPHDDPNHPDFEKEIE